jgi:hypothetical protein
MSTEKLVNKIKTMIIKVKVFIEKFQPEMNRLRPQSQGLIEIRR